MLLFKVNTCNVAISVLSACWDIVLGGSLGALAGFIKGLFRSSLSILLVVHRLCLPVAVVQSCVRFHFLEFYA